MDEKPEFTAPLSVSWCPACGLSQLDQVVDPQILYANYPFRAGVSRLWQSHCAMLMTSLESPGRRFLVDIGSNDGTLLKEAAARNWKVLGIDPWPIDAPLPSLAVLWSTSIARRVARIHGQADVVTATNVFGHVDDAKDFLEGIALILKPQGLAIIECPHILPLLERVAFDTIYHEHLSYWSLRPLELLADSVGLRVIDVQSFSELHGGTMRYVLALADSPVHAKASVSELRAVEVTHLQRGLMPYQEFAQKTREKIQYFRDDVILEYHDGKRIWGYGANAKGAMLLQAADIRPPTVERIVDDAEPKWGLLMPGSHIPITDAKDLSAPDVLVLLSWNNATELKAKAQARGFLGEFITP